MKYNKSIPSKNRDSYYAQKLRILTHCPNFQQYIKILRKKWNVPKSLISNDAQYTQWLNDFPLNTPEIKSNAKNQSLQKEQKNIRLYPLIQDLKNIINTFDLNDSFTYSIRSYILYGDFNYSEFGNNICKAIQNQNPLIFSEDAGNNRQRLFMEIFDDTTLKDIQKIYNTHISPDFYRLIEPQKQGLHPKISYEGSRARLIMEIPKDIKLTEIEEFWKSNIYNLRSQLQESDKTLQRRQGLRTFDRDERIYILREQYGYRYNIISEKIKKDFDETLSVAEIKDRYRKFKKRIQQVCSKS